MQPYSFLGAGIGHGAGILGCEQAPDFIKQQLGLTPYWEKTLYYRGVERRLAAIDDVVRFSQALSHATWSVLQRQQKFITFGGDHSCAVGTWSGVHQLYPRFGLIWVDAHMDTHTPESSPSGDLHGMPLASLLHCGDPRLTSILSDKPKIQPTDVVLIGVRSFEYAEQQRLRQLGVRIFMQHQVAEKGFVWCLAQAQSLFIQRGMSFGLSFDLDSLDPRQMPAVGTPVPEGIPLVDAIKGLAQLPVQSLIGIEFVEFNPRLDKQGQGLHALRQLLQAIPGIKQQLAW